MHFSFFFQALLHSVENFIETNLTLRLEQLEAETGHSLKDPVPVNIEYINKTVSFMFFRELFRNIILKG